jgi:hypothetical protein
MKFTIHKKTLVKMLKVISGGSIKKDAHLRIAAQDGRVTLTTEDLNEASYDAEVIAERVCFISISFWQLTLHFNQFGVRFYHQVYETFCRTSDFSVCEKRIRGDLRIHLLNLIP